MWHFYKYTVVQGRLRNDGWEMRKAEEAEAEGIDRESTWKGTCNYWKYYCKEFEIELRIPGLAVSCFRKESYNSLQFTVRVCISLPHSRCGYLEVKAVAAEFALEKTLT